MSTISFPTLDRCQGSPSKPIKTKKVKGRFQWPYCISQLGFITMVKLTLADMRGHKQTMKELPLPVLF